MTPEEPFIFNGVPWVWDDTSLRECQFCFRNGPTPYTATWGDGTVKPICPTCRYALDKWIAEEAEAK